MMTGLSRLRPTLQILLWLVCVTVAVNAGLRLLEDTPVLGWLPKAVSGTGYLEDNRHRITAAVEQYRGGAADPGDHLGAVVGISNVREGIDLPALSSAAGPGWRLIGLAGSGLGIADVAAHAEVLLSSELRPDIVMLGLGLYQMVDTKPKPGSLEISLLEYVRRGDLRNAATSIRDWLWFFSRRQDVSLAVERSVLDARDWILRVSNARVAEPANHQNSPWRDMLKSDWPEHFSAATLREEEQFLDDLGAFDARTYARSPAARATLLDLVTRFRDNGATVLVVLMPEHSRLQDRIPPEALDALKAPLEQAFGSEAPPVLDFRASVDDTGFVDLTHLNSQGSSVLTRLLADRMQQHLPARPSLMQTPRAHGAVSRVVRNKESR